MHTQKNEDSSDPSEDASDSSPPEETGTATSVTAATHVYKLLDISDDILLREQQPLDYYCYTAWADAACGWARVAPLSCILVTQKPPPQIKPKEPDLAPQLPQPGPSGPVNSSSLADLKTKSQPRSLKLKSSLTLERQIQSENDTPVEINPIEAAKEFFLSNTDRNMRYFFTEEKSVEKLTPIEPRTIQWPSNCVVFKNRPVKPQRYLQRPKNTIVDIKQFTFLPLIKPLQVRDIKRHDYKWLKADGGQNFQNKFFLGDLKRNKNGNLF